MTRIPRFSRFLGLWLLLVGCGRATESGGPSDASSDSNGGSDSHADVRADYGDASSLRPDGCAPGGTPYDLPCSEALSGKVCKYYESCVRAGDEVVTVWICERAGEKWRWVSQPTERCPDDAGVDGG